MEGKKPLTQKQNEAFSKSREALIAYRSSLIALQGELQPRLNIACNVVLQQAIQETEKELGWIDIFQSTVVNTTK